MASHVLNCLSSWYGLFGYSSGDELRLIICDVETGVRKRKELLKITKKKTPHSSTLYHKMIQLMEQKEEENERNEKKDDGGSSNCPDYKSFD